MFSMNAGDKELEEKALCRQKILSGHSNLRGGFYHAVKYIHVEGPFTEYL